MAEASEPQYFEPDTEPCEPFTGSPTEGINFPEPFATPPMHDFDLPEPFTAPSWDFEARKIVKRKRTTYSPPKVDFKDIVIPSLSFAEPFEVASEDDENTSNEPSSSSSSQSSDTSASMTNEFFIDSGLECGIDGNPPSSDNLWPGSSLSVVAAIAILFSWFSSFPGVSKEAFSHLLHILHKYILPSGNTLPGTYTEALSAIKGHLLEVQEFHCCVNDCIVYRGAYKDLTQCPHCQESRYFVGGHIPRKRFKYIPFGQRVRRYFSNKTTSQLLQKHNTATSGSIIHDIHQTQVWKEWYSRKGIFKGDSRGLALGVCLDGTNPFSKEKNKYSMWPMMVSILNLPANLRRLPGFLMLAGIIPGKSEPKNTDPYLDIFVDELTQLNGSVLFDAHQNNTFSLQTAVMLHVLDYPGQNKVFHCQGASAYAGCCYCSTSGEYSRALTKMVYLDHRRFLKPGDPLRMECAKFPKKGKPMEPPILKDMVFVDRANKRYESAKTADSRRKIAQETGCKGRYALRKLPHHDRILSTPVEPMHLIKNLVEHLVRLITGVEDSRKVRKEEKLRGRFRSSWCKKGKAGLPPAPFRLSPSELKLANQRAVSIRVPRGFDWKPNAMFVGRVAMKSHSWKLLVSTSILKYCMRGLLGNHQRHTLFFFCDILSQLCAEEVDVSQMDAIENNTHRALSMIERDFPVSLNVCVFHLLHHLPHYIHRFGPIYSFWMYPYERFNSWVIRRVQNRRFPEATVIETYRLYEWAHYLQQTGYLPDNAVLRPDSTNDIDHTSIQGTTELDIDTFQHLQQYYRETNSLYNALCKRYEHDKKRARVRHKLKEFPAMQSWQPKSGPLLTAEENQMCSGMVPTVIQSHRFTFQDHHGRKVHLGSKQTDTDSTCSSYTKMSLTDNTVIVGRIQYFFTHSFVSKSDTFAFVNWFGQPVQDPESLILFVNVAHNPSINPIVHTSKLSGPLVIAIDTVTSTKLWILS